MVTPKALLFDCDGTIADTDGLGCPIVGPAPTGEGGGEPGPTGPGPEPVDPR